MPFSIADESKLVQVHPKLVSILHDAIKHFDFMIVYGLRDMATQNKLFADKKSEVQYPNSRHNRTKDPQYKNAEYSISDAVDIVPRNTLYSDRNQLIFLQGIIKGIGIAQGVELRQGIIWDHPTITDNLNVGFFDGAHCEISW